MAFALALCVPTQVPCSSRSNNKKPGSDALPHTSCCVQD